MDTTGWFFWLGNDPVSLTQTVPRGVIVKHVRDLTNEKVRVEILPGQGKVKVEQFDAFRTELRPYS